MNRKAAVSINQTPDNGADHVIDNKKEDRQIMVLSVRCMMNVAFRALIEGDFEKADRYYKVAKKTLGGPEVKTEPNHWVNAFCRFYRLSLRESEVVNWAAQGLLHKAIAVQLSCSQPTVMTYWKRIFEKTNCRGREEVLALIIEFQSQLREACVECPNGFSSVGK